MVATELWKGEHAEAWGSVVAETAAAEAIDVRGRATAGAVDPSGPLALERGDQLETWRAMLPEGTGMGVGATHARKRRWIIAVVAMCVVAGVVLSGGPGTHEDGGTLSCTR